MRRFPRRVGPAVAKRRASQMNQMTTTISRTIGIIVMTDPQSGITNFAVKSRIEFQMSSSNSATSVANGRSRREDRGEASRRHQSEGEPAMRT
jgi:hypothetical protein